MVLLIPTRSRPRNRIEAATPESYKGMAIEGKRLDVAIWTSRHSQLQLQATIMMKL